MYNEFMNKKTGHNGIRLWAVGFWLAAWQIAGMLSREHVFFVTPADVMARLLALAGTPDFWQSAGMSYLRITSGFLLSVIFGTGLAAAAAALPRLRELLAPVMLAIRTIPVVSFVILAIILVSPRQLAVLISLTMGLPIMYTNVLDGIGQRDTELMEMARVFRIPPLRRIRRVDAPLVLPYFRAGLKVSAGLCWKAGAAAEVIGVPAMSIGLHLYQAKIYIETADLFAWTLVIVLLSLATEKLVLFLTDCLAKSQRNW